VVSALLSRSQVYVLKSLSYEKLEELAEISLKKFNEEEGTQFKIIEKKPLFNILVVMPENSLIL
jgi:putative ATPase